MAAHLQPDPLLCIALAFMEKTSIRWANKADEKSGLTDEESDPADWWKTLS
jgi:hypothetical protein